MLRLRSLRIIHQKCFAQETPEADARRDHLGTTQQRTKLSDSIEVGEVEDHIVRWQQKRDECGKLLH